MSGFHEQCQEEFLKKQVETWIETDFGPRCDTSEKSCIVCQKWKALDELFDGLTTAADEDPWVTQDRVPARVGVDEYRYKSWTEDQWRLVEANQGFTAEHYHGWKTPGGGTLLLRCRLSQLPERCEVTDRRGVVLTPWQKVFVLQTEQTRIATVVSVTDSRSSNGWWVDVDFGDGPQGIPSDILEVCNAPSAPANQPDPDEWVIQDMTLVRPGIDQIVWDEKLHDADCAFFSHTHSGSKSDGKVHGFRTGGIFLSVRCRRRDLPPVEKKTLAELCADKTPTADLSILGGPHDVCVMPLAEKPEPQPAKKVLQTTDMFLNQILTFDPATGEYSHKPQPAKTRVRLWMDEHDNCVAVSAGVNLKGDWQEIHHDAEGFYVEQQ